MFYIVCVGEYNHSNILHLSCFHFTWPFDLLTYSVLRTTTKIIELCIVQQIKCYYEKYVSWKLYNFRLKETRSNLNLFYSMNLAASQLFCTLCIMKCAISDTGIKK